MVPETRRDKIMGLREIFTGGRRCRCGCGQTVGKGVDGLYICGKTRRMTGTKPKKATKNTKK